MVNVGFFFLFFFSGSINAKLSVSSLHMIWNLLAGAHDRLEHIGKRSSCNGGIHQLSARGRVEQAARGAGGWNQRLPGMKN